MAVTASIIVQFGADAVGSVLLAEIDTREVSDGGLNPRNSFIAGDTVYYLVYAKNVLNIVHAASAGSLVAVGSGVREVTELVAFSNESAVSLQYPIDSIVSYSWFGNDLGSIVSTGGTGVRCSSQGVGIAEITYRVAYTSHKLVAPAQINGSDAFSILIVVSGEG